MHEDVTKNTLSIALREGRVAAKEILKLMKQVTENSKQHGSLKKYMEKDGTQVKLKDMVKKGQLEEITIKDNELKELRKELNRYGVKFSLIKDKETGNHTVFFQAKDTVVMNKAFERAIAKAERKIDAKASVRGQIKNLTEKVKDTILQDKVKNKHKEQSL